MKAQTPVLRPIAPGVWVVDGADLTLPGRVVFPLRMTILQTGPGRLLLYSPLALSDTLTAQIADLGQVEHIVAPNAFHHLFAGQAAARFPEAKLWASPAAQAKQPALRAARDLGDAGTTPFGPDLVCHHIPSRFAEFALFHPGSASLVVCDLVFNITPANWVTGMVLRMVGCHGKLAQSRLWRRAVKDRAAARAAAEAIVAQPFTRLIPAHGDIVTDNASARLRAAMPWMLAPTE